MCLIRSDSEGKSSYSVYLSAFALEWSHGGVFYITIDCLKHIAVTYQKTFAARLACYVEE